MATISQLQAAGFKITTAPVGTELTQVFHERAFRFWNNLHEDLRHSADAEKAKPLLDAEGKARGFVMLTTDVWKRGYEHTDDPQFPFSFIMESDAVMLDAMDDFADQMLRTAHNAKNAADRAAATCAQCLKERSL